MTRENVRAWATETAQDATTVVEIVHAGFNDDPRCGGFAFVCDRRLAIHAVDGGFRESIDPGDDPTRTAAVEDYWRTVQHRSRPLALDDVSAWHRAAIVTLEAGLSSVADLAPELRTDVTDTARADALLVRLRRLTKEPTASGALRALASTDWLLAVPGEHDRAHPCPLCGRPALGPPRYPTAVCDDCYPRSVCGEGRPVMGYNTSLGGGFEAQHADDRSVCAQVTRDGVVWVDGQECLMGEARFGGVVVSVRQDT
ncbi:hypothetical protein [Cellulomonas sp. URHD0024]|uniref:hypothetical protein n=1 Tax=Cellulomonas sp. URHD0024 TaxID=1302620 RepID=UPI0012DD3022|nr:hypothetical protein [Cellulomonas sp. URHD0024]